MCAIIISSRGEERGDMGKLSGGIANPFKNIWESLWRPVRRILLFAELLALTFYAIYLIYEIATGAFIVFKSILLGVTVVYAIFYTVAHGRADKPSKLAKKIGKRVYSAIKIVVKGCTLALTIFGFYAARNTTTFWSVTLAVLMLIGWIFSVFFEILYWVVDRQVEKIKRTTAQKVSDTRDRVKTITNNTKDKITSVKTKTVETVKNAKTKTKQTVDTAKKKAAEGIDRVKDGAKSITDGVKSTAGKAANGIAGLFRKKPTEALPEGTAPEKLNEGERPEVLPPASECEQPDTVAITTDTADVE